MERCETFHDYYLIEVYTPLALTVTFVYLIEPLSSELSLQAEDLSYIKIAGLRNAVPRLATVYFNLA